MNIWGRESFQVSAKALQREVAGVFTKVKQTEEEEEEEQKWSVSEHKWAIHGTCEPGGGFWLLLQEDSLEAEEHLACLINHRNFWGCCVQNRLWIDFWFQLRHAKILEVTTKEEVKQLKINNFACQRTEVTRQRVPLKFGDTEKYRDHSQDLLTWSSSCKSHKLIGTLKWCFDKLKEAEYGLLVA